MKMDTKPLKQEAKPARRYDIDWLRVLAVLLLLPFHSARIFDTLGPFYVKNAVLSDALSYFVFYMLPWHMPLLFLLAGASTWFALSFRGGGQYAKERFKRLLIPLIFGVLVIVPPQSYIGLISHSAYDGSFLDWYTNFFSLNARDMDGYFLGGFTLGHLWFILYLFLFSLVMLPVFLIFKRLTWGRVRDALVRFFSFPGMIFLFAIPLYLAVRLMSYPNPLYFLIIFVFGYILFSDARLGEAIDKHKLVALILGPVLYLAVPYFDLNGWPLNLPEWFRTILIAYVDGFAAWFFLVAILGYGKLFLNFTNRYLKYLGEASYPIYILHQTIIIMIGYLVVRWKVGVPVKYGAILIVASLVTFGLYDLVVKRTNLTRILFGMRPKKIGARKHQP